jgi:myo-inositol-1(or 4)-monophosphatase
MIGAARSAGACLMRYFRGGTQLEVELKGPADFVSTADLESERTLMAILLGAYPGRGIVTEESAPVPGRGTGSERYIVDPLDGTSNFVHGVPHFAVSLALEREGRIVAGVVLDPVKDETFAAERGSGAWLNGARLRVAVLADARRRDAARRRNPQDGRGGAGSRVRRRGTFRGALRVRPIAVGHRRGGSARGRGRRASDRSGGRGVVSRDRKRRRYERLSASADARGPESREEAPRAIATTRTAAVAQMS